MAKIAFIGAGSVEFTRKLVNDILLHGELAGSTLALHDIDPDRLAFAEHVANSTIKGLGADATVTTSLDRREALEGARYVINMVQIGGYPSTLVDFEVASRYGVRQTIGDTLGIGGIFRTLRTVPMLHDLAWDMVDVCEPDVWLLNYTNPMAMLCQAVYQGTPVQNVVGLCHSVQHTTNKLAGWVGVPTDELTFLSAGINHQAFLLRLEHQGVDLYPRLREAIAADPEKQRTVRVELMKHLGYFPTESSEHAAEYVPWFMGHDSEIEKFQIYVDDYLDRCRKNLAEYEDLKAAAERGEDLPPLGHSVEYAADIIHSMETGRPSVIYGNVRNDGLLTDLPADTCVEVPCVVDRTGVRGTFVGELPPQLAALNRTFANVCDLTVRAAVEEEPQHVVHAALLDPATSSVLTMDQTARLVADLVEAHGDTLPEWLRAGSLVPA